MALRRLGKLASEGVAGCRAYHASLSSGTGAAVPGRQGGFLSWLKQDSRPDVPLDQALPGVIPEVPFRPSMHPPPTEVTTLANGVRIVTEASPVSWCVGTTVWGDG
jgi:hypothetical protein